MINEVRNTVLFILNKDNNGYITPSQFNLYAKQAQIEIFESYFHDYSRAVNKRNVHGHTSGYSDIPRRLEEVIDRFTSVDVPVYSGATGTFALPTDAYKMEQVTVASGLIDVEKVSYGQLARLRSSLDTAPSTDYPVYVINENGMQVFPTSLNTTGDILANYIKYPETPNWTYNTFSGGEPLFNASTAGYQDFELPASDEMNLIIRILEYAGIEIRDYGVVEAAKKEEIQQKTEQQ
jgi:hypothetical protein